MIKVAIWGSYEHGNYGDDLMALIFANYFKSLGVKPVVYRLDSNIATRYKIDRTENIDELLEGASFCILGGGGMLVTDSWLRRQFSKVSKSFENDFKLLARALKQHNCPLFPVSIGGNGSLETKYQLPKFRNHVFSSDLCTKGTIRLEDDLHWSNTLGIAFEFVPDVLLTTPDHFRSFEKTDNKPKKIGINLVGANCQNLVSQLEKYSEHDIELVFINTHIDGYGHNYELVGSSNNATFFQHNDDFERTLSLLASLDLLISSKLHLGLTALTLKTPFISFCGKSKTESFLKSVSKQNTTFKESQESEVLKLVSNVDNLRFEQLFDENKIATFSKAATQHFDFLKNLTDQKK